MQKAGYKYMKVLGITGQVGAAPDYTDRPVDDSSSGGEEKDDNNKDDNNKDNNNKDDNNKDNENKDNDNKDPETPSDDTKKVSMPKTYKLLPASMFTMEK